MTTQFLLSGFGGQGILFAGKLLAYQGLTLDRNVSWLPSYGPEMRGGTASCSVVLSTHPVGSPLVTHSDVLVAMNLPSLDRFESSVMEGGMIFVDSSLIERKVQREDVKAFYVPATRMANENGTPTLANMILMGRVLKEMGMYDEASARAALSKVISAKHADMLDVNLRAMQLGADYE